MRMAPINKMKTYNKPNRNLVNNSLDAGKILFPGIKTRKKKKKKLQIKELPVRAVSETLFGQDSFHVSTEDTFDKLVKGNIYNPVNIKSHISIVNSSDSDVSKSIKRVNNFYSPIMMRRKKSASITEIHSNSNIGIGENKSNNAKSMIKTNDFYSPIMTRNRKRTAYIMDKTDSSISASGNNRNESEIPHFREPTVEKIDFSLEVEQARNAVPNSLSYIVIPEVKVGEISIGEVPPNHVSASKIDRSFDSFFTKTFREKQLIHSSTPLLPMKTKKMVNHTISPIKNVSRFEGSINIEKPNSTIFKNSSIPLKAANSTNIEYVLEEDWKLLAEPKVMLTINSEKGIKSLINNSESNTSEKLQNEMESQDKENLSLVNNSIPPRLSVNNMPREDFITLRRRKILKLDSGNRKRSRNTQGQKGYNICAEDFERCSVNVTKKSRSTETSEQGIKQRSVSDELSQTSIPSLQDDFVNERYKNKELVVDLTKYPWRSNGEQSIPSLGSSAEIVVINLTDSFEGKDITHTDAVKDVSVSRDEHIEKDSIPDIIESSVLEPSHVDGDGFKIPGSGARRHRSKTLVLKAGKLWRRSLAMYKRSSMMLNALNDNACRLVGGNFCACPRCNLARQNASMSRRHSIRIVPVKPFSDVHREISILENYAHRTSYVSDRILEDNLEIDLRSISLSKRKDSIVQDSAPLTARELVLKKCGQEEPLPFEECYSESLLHNCQKIGEGVYGEVFLFRNPNGGTSVMKVIPIEGDQIINGERQKKFDEILSEITIALELSSLRNNEHNKTSGFSEVQKVCCVQGRYPEKLIDLWDLYDETRGSENDSPEMFGENQLYVVLQLANGGRDLEAFVFNNALQAYMMFQQVACALAVAEEELHFEHRDLHWGNVLLSMVDRNATVTFRLDGKNYEVATRGMQVAIIDFTLSRIECDGVVIFNDLSLDPELFTADGDYQFEVYKLMQKKNGNNWQRFEPYTNVLWLHYTLDKAITALHYKNTQSKVHKEYLGKLRQLREEMLNYTSAKEFVVENF